MGAEQTFVGGFTGFVRVAEPRLKQALCGAYGREVGVEATAEALAYAWEHWDRVEGMGNPVGFLYRVGQSRVRALWRWRRPPAPQFPPVEGGRFPEVEPGLGAAMGRLSEKQRVVVVLVCGFGWTHREVGELLGIEVTTVQNHLERGLGKLRSLLGVPR